MSKFRLIEDGKKVIQENKLIFIPPNIEEVPTRGSFKRFSTYELVMYYNFDPIRALNMQP